MGLIGRNEKCHCGSGRKYKKCCLESDNNNIENGVLPGKGNKAFDLVAPKHDSSMGIKELVLAQLDQVNVWLSRESINDLGIEFNSKELLEIANSKDMTYKFFQVNREILELKGIKHPYREMKLVEERAASLPSLSENERRILRTVAESSLGEYEMLSDMQTADYGAMKVLNDFAYRSIKEGVTDDKGNISWVNLYVDTNEKQEEILVNWEYEYSDDQEVYEYVELNFCHLDELHNEYQKLAHSFHGLEDSSKDQLATALFQEKALPEKSRRRASYNGIINYYTGIFENELRILINHKEKQERPQLMMKNIVDYLHINSLPYISGNINDLPARLDEIRKIRNEISHGKGGLYEDYCKVKKLALDDEAFKFISWCKVYFEDIEEKVTPLP
ncbi:MULTISPECIES: YecA family protein [Pontibacillus]|uniref:SEC-C domain-containing protein n=1 Tax=Pontibacillus chungwhensis TaxID=265426 RepID=A0ABY8UTG2_9BACI|nr:MULTISPECIES: SEC-C domain-containing protein [Pontibacillus]MCD5323327.1 SEC-C domain-containing protein [Pontibacillus sp. HN14]WIF96708.1 SEC-C domain-containing protein [Pontibacillus chungwhensis]